MKEKNSYYHKCILRKRNCVENSIQQIKKYDRINLRKDRLLHNFMGFIYFGLGLTVMQMFK